MFGKTMHDGMASCCRRKRKTSVPAKLTAILFFDIPYANMAHADEDRPPTMGIWRMHMPTNRALASRPHPHVCDRHRINPWTGNCDEIHVDVGLKGVVVADEGQTFLGHCNLHVHHVRIRENHGALVLRPLGIPRVASLDKFQDEPR